MSTQADTGTALGQNEGSAPPVPSTSPPAPSTSPPVPSTSPPGDTLAQRRAAALRLREQVLGQAYVASAQSDDSVGATGLQELILDGAWSVWTRPGLALRDRSLMVLAMTAALGRMEEFALHVRSAPNAGVLDTELDELVIQVAAYCGAPAGIAARRALVANRASRD